MAFKKIDEDATAQEEPFDAFLLRGQAANVEAARTGRPRRASLCYPAAARPVLGSSRTMVLPVGVFPLGPYTTQVTVRVRGSCVAASVWLGVAYQWTAGAWSAPEPDVEFAVGDDEQTLALRVPRGTDAVRVGLLIRSDYVAAAATKRNHTAATTVKGTDPTEWDQGAAPGLTLTLGRRYTIAYGEHSGTPQDPGVDGYPGPFEVLDWDDAATRGHADRYIHAWPPFEGRPTTEYANFAIAVRELGALTIYGITLEESAWATTPDLAELLQAAYPTSARSVGALYQRERELWTKYTPIHHLGGTYDPAHLDPDAGSSRITQPHGALVYLDENWRKIGAAYLGDYTDEAADVEGVVQYRSTYDVWVWLYGAIMLNGPDSAPVEVRATTYSFSGGSWSGSSAQETFEPVTVFLHAGNPRDGNEAGSLIGKEKPAAGAAQPNPATPLAWHTLRPCVPRDRVESSLVRGQIEDTSPGSNRVLLLEARCSLTNSEARSDGGRLLEAPTLGIGSAARAYLWCPTFTVSSARVV